MIREYLGEKAAKAIDRTKFGDTKAGKISAAILDDERLEDIGYGGLISISDDLRIPYLRYRVFTWAIVVNATSWLSVFLIPSLVSKPLWQSFQPFFNPGC